MNHLFDVDMAVEYGVNAAIIFYSINWWCEHSEANEKHFYDGYYWTYNSIKAFQKMFPYMGEKQIRAAISTLIDAGLILKGNYNKNPYDRTLWYAVTQKGKSILPKRQMENAEKENEFATEGEPIPVIYNDNNTDISPVVVDIRTRTREEPNHNDDFNPFGDGGPDHPADTLESYAANNIVNMNGRNMEELVDYMNKLPEPLIRFAIDMANKHCKTGIPTFGYVDTILKGFVARKFTTVEQAKAAEEARQAQRAQARPTQKTTAQESDAYWGRIPFAP